MQTKIWRITLDTNPEDCNLHCIMCEEHSEYSHFKQKLLEKTGSSRRVMPEQTIIKLVREAAEMGVREIIPTTMGDPLVSSNFELIARLAAENNIHLNVTHNGTFPRKTATEWAEIIVPITSDIKISWNGATAKTAEAVMKGLNYEKALLDLEDFISFRDRYYLETGYYCRISFQLTFMRCNMLEIEQIIELAARLGIDRIKGHHLWVHNSEMEKQSFQLTDQTRKEWNQIADRAKKVAEELKKQGKNILLENFDALQEGTASSIPESYECPFLGNELWISATGKISPCCAPDALRQSLGEFGNISTVKLSELTESNHYKKLLSNYKNYEVCKKCNMRRPEIN
ncbi:MAG TPA: radical SAM protein [Bacteroidales bacterium]|nr:radical SAM protein [Bacteroidales bacterium]